RKVTPAPRRGARRSDRARSAPPTPPSRPPAASAPSRRRGRARSAARAPRRRPAACPPGATSSPARRRRRGGRWCPRRGIRRAESPAPPDEGIAAAEGVLAPVVVAEPEILAQHADQVGRRLAGEDALDEVLVRGVALGLAFEDAPARLGAEDVLG